MRSLVDSCELLKAGKVRHESIACYVSLRDYAPTSGSACRTACASNAVAMPALSSGRILCRHISSAAPTSRCRHATAVRTAQAPPTGAAAALQPAAAHHLRASAAVQRPCFASSRAAPAGGLHAHGIHLQVPGTDRCGRSMQSTHNVLSMPSCDGSEVCNSQPKCQPELTASVGRYVCPRTVTYLCWGRSFKPSRNHAIAHAGMHQRYMRVPLRTSHTRRSSSHSSSSGRPAAGTAHQRDPGRRRRRRRERAPPTRCRGRRSGSSASALTAVRICSRPLVKVTTTHAADMTSRCRSCAEAAGCLNASV